MNGVNSIIFQPIAIHQPYLLSLLPEVILGYKMNRFLSSAEIEQKYINAMAQSSAHNSNKNQSPVVLNIHGPIIKYSNWNYTGTQFYKKLIQQLDANAGVSHIILNIDSGGGMVSGTKEFCQTIRQCSTPTVAFTNGMACSAAQMIFSAADVGVASPYADLLGSVGVLISYQDFNAMFEKFGAKIYEAYAPESTEKNKMFRDWKAGNEKSIQENLSQHAQNFIATMKQYRGDKLKDDGSVFKGKTYTPAEALEIGLIDHIMTFEELINTL